MFNLNRSSYEFRYCRIYIYIYIYIYNFGCLPDLHKCFLNPQNCQTSYRAFAQFWLNWRNYLFDDSSIQNRITAIVQFGRSDILDRDYKIYQQQRYINAVVQFGRSDILDRDDKIYQQQRYINAIVQFDRSDILDRDDKIYQQQRYINAVVHFWLEGISIYIVWLRPQEIHIWRLGISGCIA